MMIDGFVTKKSTTIDDATTIHPSPSKATTLFGTKNGTIPPKPVAAVWSDFYPPTIQILVPSKLIIERGNNWDGCEKCVMMVLDTTPHPYTHHYIYYSYRLAPPPYPRIIHHLPTNKREGFRKAACFSSILALFFLVHKILGRRKTRQNTTRRIIIRNTQKRERHNSRCWEKNISHTYIPHKLPRSE